MKRVNSKVLMVIATLATVFAATVATSACFWSFYQMEEPECLSDK